MAMKQIQKDELYAHLSDFLRDKGIELKEGSYSKGIHAGCSLLADAINLSQTGVRGRRRARQTIATGPSGYSRENGTQGPDQFSGSEQSGGSREQNGGWEQWEGRAQKKGSKTGQ